MSMNDLVAKLNLDGNVWSIPNPTPGQRETSSEANWQVMLRDGSCLTDARHSGLLAEFKAFMRSALEAPEEGIRMAPGSVGPSMSAIGELASFMVMNAMDSVRDLTSEVTWDFVQFIEDEYEEGQKDVGRQRALTYSSAYRVLAPLAQIYAQRRQMEAAGVASIPEPPLDGLSTNEVVVQYMGLDERGKLTPIPDDVAIPTLERAHRWVTLGAPDVIRLQGDVLACYRDLPYQQANAAARRVIQDFRFAIDPETGREWHPRINIGKRKMLDGRVVGLSLIQSFRRLVLDLYVACTICVQGGTGIRAHEFIGLASGQGPDDEFPKIISNRKSTDLLMDVFFVGGITAKRSIAETEWLLGMRPVGTYALPAPVVALQVLQTLLEPWRQLGQLDSLLVTFRAARGLPRSRGAIGKMLACTLTQMQKEFAIVACIEDGMEEQMAWQLGRTVRGHRWRPTFAHFIFRTSPRLLIPLRDHFKHLSDVITEQGYIGNDAGLLEDLESERMQETARLLLEISHGKVVGAGTVQHLANKYGESLAEAIESTDGESLQDKALSYVEKTAIRIWNGVYAACFMDILPSKSKCNDMGVVPGFARTRPDYAQRSPGVCASCPCCWIRQEHREYWQKRLHQNEGIVLQEQAHSKLAAPSVAAARVKQSRSILNALDRQRSSLSSSDPA